MSAPRPPFPAEPGPIGAARDGRLVALAPMTPGAARDLGSTLATIDPWARAGIPAERMRAFLAAAEDGARRYQIVCASVPAGVLVVRTPWLHGPYLNLIGLVPAFHGQGIGSIALDWLDAEARGHYRNLWLCVSTFNDGARRLYERHGYRLAGVLDDLVFDGLDEHLMRKRLF